MSESRVGGVHGDGVPSPEGGGVKGQKEKTEMKARWRRERSQSSRGPACLGMGTGKKMMEVGKKLTNWQPKGALRAAKMGGGDREAQPETGMGPASASGILEPPWLCQLGHISIFLPCWGLDPQSLPHSLLSQGSHFDQLPSPRLGPILTTPIKVPAHPLSLNKRIAASSLIAA